MPYLFTDDGAPEACEYADNYRWFDQESLPALLASLQGRGAVAPARSEPEKRTHRTGLFKSLAAAFAAASLRLRARLRTHRIGLFMFLAAAFAAASLRLSRRS